jgi:hypothetical protein
MYLKISDVIMSQATRISWRRFTARACDSRFGCSTPPCGFPRNASTTGLLLHHSKGHDPSSPHRLIPELESAGNLGISGGGLSSGHLAPKTSGDNGVYGASIREELSGGAEPRTIAEYLGIGNSGIRPEAVAPSLLEGSVSNWTDQWQQPFGSSSVTSWHLGSGAQQTGSPDLTPPPTSGLTSSYGGNIGSNAAYSVSSSFPTSATMPNVFGMGNAINTSSADASQNNYGAAGGGRTALLE